MHNPNNEPEQTELRVKHPAHLQFPALSSDFILMWRHVAGPECFHMSRPPAERTN